MRLLLILISYLLVMTSHADVGDTLKIVKKKEVYFLGENCKDSIIWEEVEMVNMIVGSKINKQIYSTINTFKLDEAYHEAKCEGEMRFEAISQITGTTNNIISVIFKEQYVYPNVGYSMHIETANFHMGEGGRIVSFNELFLPDKKKDIDSLIISQIKEWYGDYDARYDQDDEKYWLDQLIKGPDFLIESDQVVVYMKIIHCGYCIDEDPVISLPFTEYRSFFNKDGVLKEILKSNE